MNNVDDYYSEGDVFLYYSKLDSLPNVLLEAMSYGLPILVNDFEPFVNILNKDENALFYDTDGMNGFSEGLQVLVSDDVMRADMGRMNIEKVKTVYSLSAVAERLKAFFELCEKGRRT